MMNDSPKRPASSAGRVRVPISLRARLILANTFIAVVAIFVLGYYVYFRAQQSSAFLTSQLDASVHQQAQESLTATSTEQVNSLNRIFASVSNGITNLGGSAASLLSDEAQLGSGVYWDATSSLARLPNGSWDNISKTDASSVFVPAREQLTLQLAAELNTLKQLDFVAPSVLKANPDAVAVYFGGNSGETLYYPNIDLASLVPPDFDVTQRPWFVSAAPAQNPSHRMIWSDPYLDAASHGLVVTCSYPVYDSAGTFRGVVAMDVQLNHISDLVSNIHVGQTDYEFAGKNIGKAGYAFMIDKNKRLIAMPILGYADFSITPDDFPLGQVLDPTKFGTHVPASFSTILSKMSAGESGVQVISFGPQERFVAYSALPEVGYSLAIIVPSAELLTGATAAMQQMSQSTTNTLQISFVLVAMILMFAVLATLGIGNTLTSPLQALTETAEEIIAGNLNAEANVRGRDEIATLGRTLNAMTSTLRDMIQSLEQRVKDRTAALQIASDHAAKRAAQFEAITQVTRAINSIQNMDDLMPLVASVISRYFDFYHVGIFLNDENNQFTWLIAANSTGGQKMLERHHSLRIGEQGIVGYVANRGEARVARNVGEDIVFFNNPDLPETKSEAALPLRSTTGISGVLDVQSTKEDAFTQDDLSILAILADQVSLAIENARLFETTRRSLDEAETLYRQYLREGWTRLPQDEQMVGYRYTPRGASPMRSLIKPEIKGIETTNEKEGLAQPLEVPIKLRGEVIGSLVVRAPRNREWSQDQVDLIRAVAERVALSAENARLFDATSRRAERERLVTEITSRIRSTNDPEEMIRTALEELRNALGATDVQVIPQLVKMSEDDQSSNIPSIPQGPKQGTRRGNGANK